MDKRAVVARREAPAPLPDPGWTLGLAKVGVASRRYRLYTPPGLADGERVPLVVMLHGCGQDASELATSTRMNRLAARERFVALYPEQDRLAHGHGCWNWYDTRNGRAQGEAALVVAAVDQAILGGHVDPARVAIAGLSAGAAMAALVATRHPRRFRAVAMHSGVAPGAAHSTATALAAMRGQRQPELGASTDAAVPLPPLLVIQGSEDDIVLPSNASAAATAWAGALHASQCPARAVQRGDSRSMQVTDFEHEGRVVVSLCAVNGLGHAWSGGAAHEAYSDAQGPDASKMIWAFATKQFRREQVPA